MIGFSYIVGDEQNKKKAEQDAKKEAERLTAKDKAAAHKATAAHLKTVYQAEALRLDKAAAHKAAAAAARGFKAAAK